MWRCLKQQYKQRHAETAVFPETEVVWSDVIMITKSGKDGTTVQWTAASHKQDLPKGSASRIQEEAEEFDNQSYRW